MSTLIRQLARPRNTSGSIDALGTLLTAAYECPDEWMGEARCSAERYHFDAGIPTPWQFDPDQQVTVDRGDGQPTVLHGEEMIELGLMSCFGCPVQYECARYAICGKMRAGTFAMRIRDLRWLQRSGMADTLIDYAEAEQLPLQRVICNAREADEARLAS